MTITLESVVVIKNTHREQKTLPEGPCAHTCTESAKIREHNSGRILTRLCVRTILVQLFSLRTLPKA